MMTLENILILNIIGIIALVYALISSEAYLWRVIIQVVSATAFLFVGVQLLIFSHIAGILYICVSLLVTLVAFVDYINTAEMAIELKKEVEFTQ